jgi:single-stranded DNA-specific DHH superfamily exonuclease
VPAYDIFNGDADGLCALRQLRLNEALDAQLITGAKREIALVRRVQARAGDRLTVLDISLHENRDALLAALEAGATCLYFDHHFPGPALDHPRLQAHISYTPEVCTSLLVDAWLSGAYRAWAVAAAFGDNLPRAAVEAARPLRLKPDQLDTLRSLGECLNYNAYGDSVEDLYYHPADLYRRLAAFDDPLEFAARDGAFETLRTGYQADLARAQEVAPRLATATHLVTLLPDERWSRRVSGPWANRLATANPQRAHAVLVRKGDCYSVSVRAPQAHPHGADALCRRFATGGGRPGAAGVTALPANELARFVAEFQGAFPSAEGPAGQ